MEQWYGKSDRVWVMDRGMVSDDNIDFLRDGGRRYIVGTPKSMLKKFEQELLKEDWHTIREGIEVKLCKPPHDQEDSQPDAAADPTETFILCRSRDRLKKDEAILRRFEQKIQDRLKSMTARCEKQNRDPMKVEREVGRLLGQNTRAAKLFDVTVESTDEGHAKMTWKKLEVVRNWATLSAGCYLLRTNVTDWSDEELWKAYIQLTEAEAAFRIHLPHSPSAFTQGDLSIRPIWHQKQDRVLAHILVCFLASALPHGARGGHAGVLWKMLSQLCAQAGLGNEPRRVLSELSDIRLVDVILPTRDGVEIRRRCITRPSGHQQILLDHLKLRLPAKIKQFDL